MMDHVGGAIPTGRSLQSPTLWSTHREESNLDQHLLLAPTLLRRRRHLPACARLQLARTMMEPICSRVPSSPAAPTIVAATALPPLVVLDTHGCTPTMNAG